MSAAPIRKVHLTREEDAAIREANAQKFEDRFPAIAEAIRAHNTDRDFVAAEYQWGWTK